MHLCSTPNGAVNLLCLPCCHTALPASWRIVMQISLDYAKSVQRQVLCQNSQGPLIPRTPAYIIRPKTDNTTEYTLSVFPSYFSFCLFVLFLLVFCLFVCLFVCLIVFKKNIESRIYSCSLHLILWQWKLWACLSLCGRLCLSVSKFAYFSSCTISATVSLSVWHVALQRTCCRKCLHPSFVFCKQLRQCGYS